MVNFVKKMTNEEEKKGADVDDADNDQDIFDPDSDKCQTCGGCGGEE